MKIGKYIKDVFDSKRVKCAQGMVEYAFVIGVVVLFAAAIFTLDFRDKYSLALQNIANAFQ